MYNKIISCNLRHILAREGKVNYNAIWVREAEFKKGKGNRIREWRYGGGTEGREKNIKIFEPQTALFYSLVMKLSHKRHKTSTECLKRLLGFAQRDYCPEVDRWVFKVKCCEPAPTLVVIGMDLVR